MTPTRWRLLVAAVVSAACTMTAASASLLPASSWRVGSGQAVVAKCDGDGVGVTYTNTFDTAVADYRTTGVTVTGVAAGCNGRLLSIAVRDAGGASLWQSSATVTGTSVVIAATPFRSASVAGWAISIGG